MHTKSPKISARILIFKMALCLCIILYAQQLQAQLPSFSIQLTNTPETCSGNGTLTFATTGSTPDATMVFRIYRLPNVATPISTQSTNTLGGLVAANYRVVATQSLLSNTNSCHADCGIAGNIVPLAFQLLAAKAVCGNDGALTVNVSQSTAVSYEIFFGPVIRPPQASNIFEQLPAGAYKVRVFDGCGQGLVQDFDIGSSILSISIGHQGLGSGENCNTFVSSDIIQSTLPLSIIAFPLTVQYIVYPPSGPVQLFTQTVAFGGNLNQQLVNQVLPMFYDQEYDYNIKVTDHCGNIYLGEAVVVHPKLQLQLEKRLLNCDDFKLEVSMNVFGRPPFTVSVLSAPAGFNPLLYNADHPGPFNTGSATYYNPALHLPTGNYDFKITDACGRTAVNSIYLDYDFVPQGLVLQLQRPGCGLGIGSLFLFNNLEIHNAEIISAPPAYPYSLPRNVNYGLANAQLSMGDLPEGTYVFRLRDRCGNIQLFNTFITGYRTSHTVSIVGGCNSFNLQLEDSSNAETATFWLQKLNSSTGQWGNPQTGFSDGLDPTSANAIQLNNNSLNLNMAFTGSFRVMKRFLIFVNADIHFNSMCIEEIHNFSFTGQPEITDIYSFQCAPNSLSVVITAGGTTPLSYSITTKNGFPFPVDNGTSCIFTGLQPGIYNFQVRDGCGNILNRLFDIRNPVSLIVSAANFCDGQTASLSLPAFSFLHYKWWKGNNTTTILSSANQLLFPSFNPVTDSGIYHVRVTYPSSSSCIDFTLDYDVNVNAAAPEAGIGTEVSFCERPVTIDLFSLLSGTYSNGGTWQDMDGCGSLTANNWSTVGLAAGVYHFKYLVQGLCSSAQTVVTVHLKELPEVPMASADFSCAGSDIYLNCHIAANTIYQWTGPNGFTSNETNPVISNAAPVMSGTYYVTASLGGCVSEPATVELTINLLPKVLIASSCSQNNFTITASPSDNSFNVEEVAYSWTGPDGFSGNANPAVISGNHPGTYHLTITAADGCTASINFEFANTLCGFPEVLSPNEDGMNDTFDLSGFDVENLQVMNRWGRVVFEQGNYTNEWHGQNDSNDQLPSGTYFYLIRLKSGDEKTGWVFITDER